MNDHDRESDNGNAGEDGYGAGSCSPPCASPAYSHLQLTIMTHISWSLEQRYFYQIIERGEGDHLFVQDIHKESISNVGLDNVNAGEEFVLNVNDVSPSYATRVEINAKIEKT